MAEPSGVSVGGSQLFRTESAGPVKDARLTPRIAETARALWLVYVGLNLICALAYWAAGMSVFDAVGHAFSTLATGGFSTHDANFGYFQSPLIQAIATLFMFVAVIPKATFSGVTAQRAPNGNANE